MKALPPIAMVVGDGLVLVRRSGGRSCFNCSRRDLRDRALEVRRRPSAGRASPPLFRGLSGGRTSPTLRPSSSQPNLMRLDELAATLQDGHEGQQGLHDGPALVEVLLERRRPRRGRCAPWAGSSTRRTPSSSTPRRRTRAPGRPMPQDISMCGNSRASRCTRLMSPELSLMAGSSSSGRPATGRSSPIDDAGAGGIVVEHDRQVRGAVDRQRVDRVLALGRQRVGGRGDQDGVGADLPGVPRVLDRILGPRPARADDEGGAALDDLLGEGRQGESLLGGLRVVFAGRAADDDAVDARGDQALEHVGELGPVDLASRPEGRDGGCVDALELHASAPTRDAPRLSACPRRLPDRRSSVCHGDRRPSTKMYYKIIQLIIQRECTLFAKSVRARPNLGGSPGSCRRGVSAGVLPTVSRLRLCQAGDEARASARIVLDQQLGSRRRSGPTHPLRRNLRAEDERGSRLLARRRTPPKPAASARIRGTGERCG